MGRNRRGFLTDKAQVLGAAVIGMFFGIALTVISILWWLA